MGRFDISSVTTAPSDLIRVLKTQTSREIHKDERMDGHVKKYIYGNAPLWQPSYFIATTGTTVMEKVREYIDSQKTEEHRRKYEKTGNYSKKTKRSR
jgi:putative transposase